MILGIVVVIFIVVMLLFFLVLGLFFSGLCDVVIGNFDWFFLIVGNIFVLLCFGLILLLLGLVCLGGFEVMLDFSLIGWFLMLFVVGMGIGLMFYGVSEFLGYFIVVLGGLVVENGVCMDWVLLDGVVGDDMGVWCLVMVVMIFYWGLYFWVIYVVVVLVLVLFVYNKGLLFMLCLVFYFILGDWVWGWLGYVVDVLVVMVMLFGLVILLGIGVE